MDAQGKVEAASATAVKPESLPIRAFKALGSCVCLHLGSYFVMGSRAYNELFSTGAIHPQSLTERLGATIWLLSAFGAVVTGFMSMVLLPRFLASPRQAKPTGEGLPDSRPPDRQAALAGAANPLSPTVERYQRIYFRVVVVILLALVVLLAVHLFREGSW